MTQLIIVSEQPDETFGIHSVTLEFGATEGERQTASVLNSVLGAVIELLKQGDEEALRQLLELCKVKNEYRRWYSWLWFRFTARSKFYPVVSNRGVLKRAKRRTWRYNRRPVG